MADVVNDDTIVDRRIEYFVGIAADWNDPDAGALRRLSCAFRPSAHMGDDGPDPMFNGRSDAG